MNPDQRVIAQEAMDEWTAVANITFRPREFLDTAWVHIRSSSNDLIQANYVGSIGIDGLGYELGERKVNIFQWKRFVVAHELGHILGFVHEQNRVDRDAFITIEWTNILGGFLDFNYALDPLGKPYGPYDFDSVMQYDACGFSNCGTNCAFTDAACRAITVLPPNTIWQTLMGQREHLSTMDKLTMSLLYPQSNWRFLDAQAGLVQLGTFLRPVKDFATAKGITPAAGTLWIQPGSYEAVGIHANRMTLRAPLGGVLLRTMP